MSNIDTTMNNALNMAVKQVTSNDALNKISVLKADKVQDSEKTTLSAGKLAEIEAAAQDFEAVFISEMMKPMFQTIKTNDTFGGGQGEDVFKGMLVQEYGKIMSESGGLGIADHVRAELIKIQENAQ